MKKTFIAGGLFLFIFGLCIIFSKFLPLKELFANEHPTKEEWLEVYITHKIKQSTDLWQQRISVDVLIRPKEKVISITLASANGQDEISQSAKDGYIHSVEIIVKAIVENYDCTPNYKLSVNYL